MSTVCGEEMFGIGQRLREERTRLGLSQAVFGAKLGTTDRTIKKYEGNETSPRATELLIASSFGIDVLYVITGTRQSVDINGGRVAYAPAERAAGEILTLKLSEEDAVMLVSFAQRLSIK